MPAPAPAAVGFWKRNQLKLAPWFFLLPGMIMFGIYVLWPILESIWMSFHDWDGLGEMTWIGTGNYTELMSDDQFHVALKNNLIWLALYLLAIPMGLAAALFLNQTITGIRIYKSLLLFPFVISQVVVGLMFTWFYAPGFGPLGLLLEWLTGSEVAILADERLAT